MTPAVDATDRCSVACIEARNDITDKT